MKTRLVLFLALLLFSTVAFSQEYKKHTVTKGETVRDIAKKYKVTPYDIHRLNPDAKNGVKDNMVLLIPTQGAVVPPVLPKEQPTKVVNTIHVLQPSETFYSLSKKYNVAVVDIEKANPHTSIDDLQIGQEIVIPIKGSTVAAQVKKVEKVDAKENVDAYIYHTVVVGETKYSIARDFGMTLQLLEELNPEVKDLLPLGYELKLVNKKIVNNQTVITTIVSDPNYMTYIVRPKETFYNLGKKTGLTEEEIIALNPDAKEGLKEGMELKLPKAKTVNDTIVITDIKVIDLKTTLVRSMPKEIALLIPFNLERVETDTVRAQLLRNDKFLNITLDFYAGALVAIDSAEALGLPLRVKILDAKETRNTSDIAAIKSSLYNTDVVIGPFFPNNVETAASILGNVPVISPLSKEYSKQYPNLFQSIPSPNDAKKALLDYLTAQGGNILAITDAKKASSRQYLREKYPTVKMVALNAEGKIDVAVLKAMMIKGTTNYVLLETERTAMAINVTKLLADLLPEYAIQLAVPENNEIFENAEIPISRLTDLKMIYPSVTNDSKTEQEQLFVKKFKEKNGYVPNQFATRGFDVTFDIILRLFQPELFATVMDTVTTEQVDNKFSYKLENGGYRNTGIYIMQFDDNFTIKQAGAKPINPYTTLPILKQGE
ncbi:LysM peptidoglycan-binding domain-containing protein [Flavobacterium arcticum]|uniref:LysM peptidoglycan-binding domain-containing protein n=1 Tax=Flavobacterium arcticum TaxID=1784713 RepID=A0A345HER5_9FLAO|nr:LysM peptidoglycan-binding domain-containing protein [Flavobacterium arcticum]AXG75075.1 LysM peptidoglycan-binding domain-containing protein [Flavobacterium arcticum]KAF2511144.1 LysM peptidoglycan-binding domain-containing protein [Flavobacterium arcticum]